jgi:hypothetical protein
MHSNFIVDRDFLRTYIPDWWLNGEHKNNENNKRENYWLRR